MSNETKRDVFEEVVAIYEAYLDDALEQAKDPHPDAGAKRGADKFQTRYSAALPDYLPVIPEAVGEYIKKANACGKLSIIDPLWHVGDTLSAMGESGLGDRARWILHHSDDFARAWVLGVWIVEETGEIVKLEVKD